MSKIIVFGCWGDSNNIDNNNNPWFKTVFNEIKTEENVDFFIVNGDNYYQKKNKDKEEDEDKFKESILVSIPDTLKTTTTSKSKKKKSTDKQVEEDNLKTGFENFFTLLDEKRETQKPKELFLLMGNHDLESINGECKTTILEIEQVKNYNGKERIHLPTNLTMFKEINETLFIMIDTNIYTDDIKKHVNCYDIIIDNNNNNNKKPIYNNDDTNEEKIKSLINHQSNLIVDELKGKNYNNIIVCGHHPLFGIKNQKTKIKNGKPKKKGGIETLSKDFYDLFLNVINEKADNYYYLCADIHNYQKGKVTISKGKKVIKINQYIAGTSGASQDDDYDEKYYHVNNKDVNNKDVNNKDGPCILHKQFPKESNDELINDDLKLTKTPKFYVFSLKKDVDEINLKYEIDQHTSQYGYIVVEIINDIVTIQPRMIQGNPIKNCVDLRSRKGGNSLPLRRTYKTRSRPRSRSKRRSLRKI
jgi:hypothetical protein